MLEIYLMRHGETNWSKSGKHTGLTDLSLNDDGKDQAKALYGKIKHLNFDTVYCSPLARAKQTCDICNLLNNATITSDLLEWDYGDYEGLTTDEIHQTDPGWSVFSKDPRNGETSHQVEQRADRLIQELLKLDGKVALFSSGHFLRCFVSRWLGFSVSHGMYYALSTASLSILSFEHDNQVVKSWNIPPM